MKKLTLIAAVTINFLLLTFNSFSQPCLPDGITFSTQSQIDSFQVNYPGCTEIEGTVKIIGNDITNLDSLNTLTSIGSRLIIYNNPVLNNLNGLGNLSEIGFDLKVNNNNSLINFYGLENLITVNGDLDIHNNDSLNCLYGLENINPANLNRIYIRNNPSLTQCNIQSLCNNLLAPNNSINIFSNAPGCNNPSEIATDCGINLPCLPYGNYYFYSQSDIINFQVNYPGCSSLNGYVIIEGEDITDLLGLETIESVQTHLFIQNCTFLVNLEGLNNLDSVGGQFEILYNDSLTSLSGLEGLNFIGHCLIFVYDHALTNIEALSNVNAMQDGVIGIWYNNAIANLSGLDNIDPATISMIDFHGNPLLSECEANTVCEFLQISSGSFYNNAPGCNSPEEVEEACDNSCLPEGIIFTTQSQIDSFQINYPGCTVIEGDVFIQGDSIFNLNGLIVLTEIEGDLKILDNNSLKTVSGLDNLFSVGDMVSIHSNDSLMSLSGLNGLNIINGHLYFSYNYMLTSLTGLESLTTINGFLAVNWSRLYDFSGLDNLSTVGDDLIINGNSNLTSLNGINNLTYVGNNIEIENNYQLTDLTSLSGLTSLTENLIINNNNALTSLSGLEGLTNIQENLQILNNASLTYLTGLNNLNVIENLIVDDNDALINLTGLENLISISSIHVENNEALSSLFGIENIATFFIDEIILTNNPSLSICDVESICEYLLTPSANIVIYNNAPGCNSISEVGEECLGCFPEGIMFYTQAQIDSFPINYPNCNTIQGTVRLNGQGITSLTSLSNIQTIEGDLICLWLSNLDNLSGLENLSSIGGSLHLGMIDGPAGNPGLSDITALQNLSSIGEAIEIIQNPEFTDLAGLENITQIPGDLYIYDNTNLTSLSGLDNLTNVGYGLWVEQNNSLADLSGLNNLNSISYHLWVVANDSITSLNGIDNLEINPNINISIHGNPLLSVCHVESICEYLISPNGNISIYSNAEGCNSQQQVEEACLESCLPEGITFNTQEEIDNFQTNYPYCTEIEGGVLIEGSSITNLDSLHNITLIGGYL